MNRYLAAVFGVLSLVTPAAASAFYDFQIDTSSLTTATGPFALDLFFIDGGNGTNNAATVLLTGGSSATLQDSFFSEQQLAFVPVPLLRFQLAITTDPDLGSFFSPDQFSIAMLHNGVQFTTTDPTGGNALIGITLPAVPGGMPAIQFTDSANRTFQPGFASLASVPEPSTAVLGIFALALFYFTRKRYKPDSLQSAT